LASKAFEDPSKRIKTESPDMELDSLPTTELLDSEAKETLPNTQRAENTPKKERPLRKSTTSRPALRKEAVTSLESFESKFTTLDIAHDPVPGKAVRIGLRELIKSTPGSEDDPVVQHLIKVLEEQDSGTEDTLVEDEHFSEDIGASSKNFEEEHGPLPETTDSESESHEPESEKNYLSGGEPFFSDVQYRRAIATYHEIDYQHRVFYLNLLMKPSWMKSPKVVKDAVAIGLIELCTVAFNLH
jgi:hypothetical protein